MNNYTREGIQSKAPK